jgi:RimJ/RimL family protein N-acetyltransferase
MADLDRCLGFIQALNERRARRVVPCRYGRAYFDDELPLVWYLNELVIDPGEAPSAGELAAEAERVQAGLQHRKLSVGDEALGERLAPALHAEGWNVERLVVMTHAAAGRAVDASRAVEISERELEPLLYEEHRRDGRDEEEARQLVAARQRTREAVSVRSLAVLENGYPVASCELYLDGRVAQVENVGTLAEQRGRGHASALVTRAVETARADGHGLVFLLADENDWPKELYAKLGFRTVGRLFQFIRARSLDDARLRAIRLRTPRLELRVPTAEEVDELYQVAAAGIHPREEMPFAIAWTDSLTIDSFRAHFANQLAEWNRDDWFLSLVVFRDRRPIGNQSIGAERFAESGTVRTGSWLGRAFQRGGIGTEMRAAVLELAFRGLGASAAESGALAGNVASMRVSEKLGYQAVGEREVSPRGEPVRETEYRIERKAWQCPIEVEIEGLEPALPLFGPTSGRSR